MPDQRHVRLKICHFKLYLKKKCSLNCLNLQHWRFRVHSFFVYFDAECMMKAKLASYICLIITQSLEKSVHASPKDLWIAIKRCTRVFRLVSVYTCLSHSLHTLSRLIDNEYCLFLAVPWFYNTPIAFQKQLLEDHVSATDTINKSVSNVSVSWC